MPKKYAIFSHTQSSIKAHSAALHRTLVDGDFQEVTRVTLDLQAQGHKIFDVLSRSEDDQPRLCREGEACRL